MWDAKRKDFELLFEYLSLFQVDGKLDTVGSGGTNTHTNASEAFLGYSGREEPEGPSNEVEVVQNPQLLSDYRVSSF